MRVLLIGCAAALALAGCGGDGTLSKSQFVSRANAICRAANQERTALGAPASAAQLSTFVDNAVALVRGEIRRLATLTPRAPAEVKPQYDRTLGLLNEAADTLAEVGPSVARGDTAAIGRLETGAQDLTRQARALARGLGLRDCAR